MDGIRSTACTFLYRDYLTLESGISSTISIGIFANLKRENYICICLINKWRQHEKYGRLNDEQKTQKIFGD